MGFTRPCLSVSNQVCVVAFKESIDEDGEDEESSVQSSASDIEDIFAEDDESVVEFL